MDPFERGVAKAQAAQDATEAEQARAARLSKETIDRLFALLSPKIAEIGYQIWVDGGSLLISKWRESHSFSEADIYLRAAHPDYTQATINTPNEGDFNLECRSHPLLFGRNSLTDDQVLEAIGIYYASTKAYKAEGDESKRRYAAELAQKAADAQAQTKLQKEADAKERERVRKNELGDKLVPWLFGLGLLFVIIYFAN